MNDKDRELYAAQIINNPLWVEICDELPRKWYMQFRATTDREMRDRLALAHDIWDEVRSEIEQTAAMGVEVSKTNSGDA